MSETSDRLDPESAVDRQRTELRTSRPERKTSTRGSDHRSEDDREEV